MIICWKLPVIIHHVHIVSNCINPEFFNIEIMLKYFDIGYKIVTTILLFLILIFIIRLNDVNQPKVQKRTINSEPVNLQKVNINTANRPVLGDHAAKVELVVFSDFTCPHCFELYKQIESLKSDYINTGLVKYIYISHPLGWNLKSQVLANIAEYANQKDMFWETYPVLFNYHEDIYEENYAKYFPGLMKDSISFKEYISKPNRMVDNNVNMGKEIGLRGVPAFAVNGILYMGKKTNEEFKAILDKAIKEADEICE